ncbi:MAG: molybdopterin-dependent oxidoreductase [Chloroflexota bacterium]
MSTRLEKGGTARLSWPVALALAVPATVVAIALMFWARDTYQIRTLPERILDWSLQFIPIDFFEAGLEKFGTSAKHLALDGNYVGLAAILIVLGAAAIRKGASSILGLAFGLWLFAMLVVMPVTGAGFFGMDLPQDVLLTDASYLALALAYGTVLLVLWWLTRPRVAGSANAVTVGNESRRALIGAVAGTGVAYAATFWLGQNAGASNSSLPLANVSSLHAPTAVPSSPSPVATVAPVVNATPVAAPTTATTGPAAVVATAAPVPTVAAASQPTVVATSAPVATPTPVPTAAGKIVIPPRPAPAQAVPRDQNGALSASTQAMGQLAGEYTPANGFYITTKNAGGDPVVDPAKWRLVLDGEVANPVQLDLPILYQLPSIQIDRTLECISNWVNQCQAVPFGCGLIGNAHWKGVRLKDVLALGGGLKPGVVGIVTRGADEFTSYLPADPELLNDTLLVYEMNGKVLPLEHGYPARLLVPGRYGMKSPKWVIGIQPTRTVTTDYYGRLGWSKDGIVQAMTRIDVPGLNATLPAGPQRIAGIAYAGSRGVSRVEFSADGGQTWKRASFLEDPPDKDVWARWQGTFVMSASGSVNLAARCVDGNGTPQNTTYTITQPNGGTGLDSITVKSA